MPFLGERHWYKYTSDDTNDYKIQLVDYLAEAAGFEKADDLPMLPRRLSPRHFWLQATECTKTKSPARKKLIVPTLKDVAKFKAGSRLIVGGIEMKVMGYLGESRSFGKNKPSANPLCQGTDN